MEQAADLNAVGPDSRGRNDNRYTWRGILSLALKHKPRLVRANMLAILATVVSVPIPLLLPVLVDEVLLDEAGPVLPVITDTDVDDVVDRANGTNFGWCGGCGWWWW